MTPRRPALTLALLATLTSTTLAQTPATPSDTPAPRPHPNAGFVTHTFYLSNAAEARNSNEVVTALRNILDPPDKIYLLPSVNAFVLSAPPDQVELATRLLAELDRPHKTYRLTYTLTTVDNGERTGTEHFSIAVVAGQHTVLKQGSRVPVVTGTSKPEASTSESQYTYLDIGMNFQADLSEFATGVSLSSRIEQSSIAPEQSAAGATDPVIRQTFLEGTSILTLGKSFLLGSLDIPGSTRHIDVAVLVEPAA